MPSFNNACALMAFSLSMLDMLFFFDRAGPIYVLVHLLWAVWDLLWAAWDLLWAILGLLLAPCSFWLAGTNLAFFASMAVIVRLSMELYVERQRVKLLEKKVYPQEAKIDRYRQVQIQHTISIEGLQCASFLCVHHCLSHSSLFNS
jgi:hypothetical protein